MTGLCSYRFIFLQINMINASISNGVVEIPVTLCRPALPGRFDVFCFTVLQTLVVQCSMSYCVLDQTTLASDYDYYWFCLRQTFSYRFLQVALSPAVPLEWIYSWNHLHGNCQPSYDSLFLSYKLNLLALILLTVKIGLLSLVLSPQDICSCYWVWYIALICFQSGENKCSWQNSLHGSYFAHSFLE